MKCNYRIRYDNVTDDYTQLYAIGFGKFKKVWQRSGGTGQVFGFPELKTAKENIAFEPPLPAWKTKAIHRLGMGNVAKVSLGFSGALAVVPC